MVAITVILAAVIASFVLGLGDQGDPAPTPTIESDFSTDELTFDITGGDEFDGSVSELQLDVTVEESGNSDDLSTSVALDEDDAGTDLDGTDTSGASLDMTSIDPDATAGDSIVVTPDGSNAEITSWEVEIVWNPSDQDSTIIYEDSSN
ncbi:type IV pilin [Halovenus sp. HT40]|uniref:type IV pilin n=1 Tax=Halovenus sp. HT40 TaxID=3126691 RepID=UPI003FA5C52D